MFEFLFGWSEQDQKREEKRQTDGVYSSGEPMEVNEPEPSSDTGDSGDGGGDGGA